MMIIRKVTSYQEIQGLDDPDSKQAIYEMMLNDEMERIFQPCPISKPQFLKTLFGPERLKNHYYISPNDISIVLGKEIHIGDTHVPIALTLNLKISLDILGSDSGKGLPDWLAEHDGHMDKKQLRSYVQESLTPNVLQYRLGLAGKSLRELNVLNIGQKAFRQVLPHWLSVDCQVTDAVEKTTQSQIDRENEAIRQAEAESRLQEQLDRLARQKAELVRQIENQKLENELAKLRAENSDMEKQRQADMLQGYRDMLWPTQAGKQMTGLQIDGEPYPAESLVLNIRDVRLELCAKRNAVLGRVRPNSDISINMPEGIIIEDEKQRRDMHYNISRAHTMLEWRGDAVFIKNLSSSNMTYINGKEISLKGASFAGDVEIGFSWFVRWQAHVHACTGHLRLPCCDGCAARGVSSMVLAYPGWTKQYKVFVWQCCVLKQVDPRLPDWRVVYQSGAQGSEGAFYLLTSQGQCVYLRPGKEIEENGIAMSVEAIG